MNHTDVFVTGVNRILPDIQTGSMGCSLAMLAERTEEVFDNGKWDLQSKTLAHIPGLPIGGSAYYCCHSLMRLLETLNNPNITVKIEALLSYFAYRYRTDADFRQDIIGEYVYPYWVGIDTEDRKYPFMELISKVLGEQDSEIFFNAMENSDYNKRTYLLEMEHFIRFLNDLEPYITFLVSDEVNEPSVPRYLVNILIRENNGHASVSLGYITPRVN